RNGSQGTDEYEARDEGTTYHFRHHGSALPQLEYHRLCHPADDRFVFVHTRGKLPISHGVLCHLVEHSRGRGFDDLDRIDSTVDSYLHAQLHATTNALLARGRRELGLGAAGRFWRFIARSACHRGDLLVGVPQELLGHVSAEIRDIEPGELEPGGR